ncbi:MTOR-associated protein MEAK7 [Lycorma delicatula]|uniref:MTOR-associated protein MEAK7 n=1 Tax=Lycorma delicatula TaxID=130591 RepID=UPI003F515F3F
MGNNNSKKKRTRKCRLSVCEITRISDALDGSCSVDVSKGVNIDVIQVLWKQELIPSLLVQYQNYLFPHVNSRCSVEEFGDLYVQLVRGSYEEKALTIAKVVGTESDDHEVLYDKMVKYVADLLQSYLKGVERRKTREFLSWHGKVIESVNNENILAIANDWCRDLKQEDSPLIPMEKLEQWLHSCGVVATLHRVELGILFGLDEEDEIGMLPLLMNPEALGRNNHSVLEPAHILHLNFLLPQDYQREWRFLFSTTTHGESFSMLLGKIIDKGPTIIVIVDDHHHMFGGFASQSWTLSPKFQGDVKCFLFTLLPEVKVFHPTGYNEHFMYLNYHQQSMPNGLGMGGQFNYWGLWLDGEFGGGQCSDVCTTYNKYTMLSENKKFLVKHLEIWGVGPAPLSSEEKGERPGILDKDPTARKILELAGKPEHSAGLRGEAVA